MLSLQFEPITLFLHRQRHIHFLARRPLLVVRGHHHFPQTRIVKSDGCGRGSVQFMQCHAVAPDGSPALHDHQRAPKDAGLCMEFSGEGDDNANEHSGCHCCATGKLSQL